MNNINFKQTSIDLKDFDEKKGIVIAYANAYNNIDSDGDISAKGSFDKTVSENYKRIRVLRDHNPTVSLGVPLEINTKDDFGLLTTTQFNLKKEVSRDMFSDIQLMHTSGLNAELSIGYQVMQRDAKNKALITEYKLMEYSFLSSWAANELSTVQGIKTIKSTYGILELIEKSYNLNYSDARLRQIETILKALANEPSEDDTPKVKPLNEYKQIINNFLNK